jgi:phosphate transport system permease protein
MAAVAQMTLEELRAGLGLRKQLDKLFVIVGLSIVLACLGILTILFLDLVRDGSARFGWDFFTSFPSRKAERAGILSAAVGTTMIMFVTALVALPVGVAAAIYLEEYAPKNWLTGMIEINVTNLAGVPSIVYGILGLVVFVQTLRSITGPDSFGRSFISGGLTLAVLVLPIIILITMEALRAVPKSIREAAYGVGATRWEVVRSHVLPYAAPGIFTGAILSLARAFGETAPLLLVGAVTGYLSTPGGRTPLEILQGQYTSLPTQIFSWSRLAGDGWKANTAAAIIVLLVIILAVNLVAILLRNRYDRKW